MLTNLEKYIKIINKKWSIMNINNIKKLAKYFILFFLVAFFVVNWANVSWIFNYKAISGIASEFFNRGEVKPVGQSTIEQKTEKVCLDQNRIEIPIIEVSAPVISTDKESEVYNDLNTGVVHFPGSADPGEQGQTLILGHSAPPNWPKIKYDGVFSRLNDLQPGDQIAVYYNCQKITYTVQNKYFIDRGEEIPKSLTSTDSMLVLISCWPPGKDYKRIAVEAKMEIKADI
jgi:LPXTG-site transpeptidase (sortase) family protein